LIERAKAAEAAARAVSGVTNSEGAEASWGQTEVALVASNGFAGSYALSRHGVSVAVVAGSGQGMERDYDFATAVHGADLEASDAVGRRAGERAVKRLDPRKVATMQAPVVYDPRVAPGIIGHLAGAINGTGIARGTSFLKDSLGKAIFNHSITIVDEPHRPRGLRSRPFDAEGLPTRRLALVEGGVLQSWILDLASARQLGLASTGHAARGTSSPPSPSTSNFYLEPGAVTPAELIDDIAAGLYVTELMGFGVNGITGDYSRGAAGFWIENGAIAYPVSEITVAGNLKTMFRELKPANDLVFRSGTDAPTLRIDGMTIAGR
jgi:PmbA protein